MSFQVSLSLSFSFPQSQSKENNAKIIIIQLSIFNLFSTLFRTRSSHCNRTLLHDQNVLSSMISIINALIIQIFHHSLCLSKSLSLSLSLSFFLSPYLNLNKTKIMRKILSNDLFSVIFLFLRHVILKSSHCSRKLRFSLKCT